MHTQLGISNEQEDVNDVSFHHRYKTEKKNIKYNLFRSRTEHQGLISKTIERIQ